MSRPVKPNWTVPVHAPDVNYPAGSNPWSGTPTKQTHPGSASVGLTPGTGVAAQVINKLFHDAFVADENAKDTLEELVDHTGQLAPLNFRDKVTVGASSNRSAVYDSANQRWLLVGDTEDVLASRDNGFNWSSFSSIATAGADEDCYTVAVDEDGNAVIGTDTEYVFTLATDDSAAKVSFISGIDPCPIQLAYEPDSGLFSALVWTGIATYVKTSANAGATWTLRTLPVQWSDFPSYDALANILICEGGGRIVVVGQGTATPTCRVMTSDDGGITWTDRGTFSTTIVSATRAGLSYNPDRGEFMYVIGESSGTPTSEVWTSPTGETWTKKTTLAASAFHSIAPYGSAWVGTASSGGLAKVVYSVDGGATWDFAGLALDGAVRGIYAGGGGLAIVTSLYVYFSLRTGRPSLGVLT